MKPIAVHPHWLTALQDTTRYVEVAGLTLPVSIQQAGKGYLATHMPTGCWGYGSTEDAAVADCGDALAQDRAWYLHQTGATLPLDGAERDKRQALRALFGGEA